MAITVNTELELLQADRQFIDLVNNRITIYGQIPYTVPQKLIIDIIKESARYFYRHYFRATQKSFLWLLKDDIIDYVTHGSLMPGFENLADYQVQLPGYVSVVMEVYETNMTTTPTSQELLNNIQLLQRSAPYGQSVLGINNSLYIIEAGCRMIEEQAYQSIFGTSTPFNFNPLTRKLNIHKVISANLMLECLINVDIQMLYNDDLFIRHVITRTKTELKRLIASHTIELPGGATLNADEICNNLDDVEKVEEILKQSGGIGDIIMMR